MAYLLLVPPPRPLRLSLTQLYLHGWWWWWYISCLHHPPRPRLTHVCAGREFNRHGSHAILQRLVDTVFVVVVVVVVVARQLPMLV